MANLHTGKHGIAPFERNTCIHSDRKTLAVIFLVNFSIIFASYSIFILQFHFSCDTFAALSPNELSSVNLRNGRVVHYLLYGFVDAVYPSLPKQMGLTSFILTVVLAFSATSLFSRFADILNIDNFGLSIALDIAALLLFINPCILLGWYYWPETCIGGSMGILATTLAMLLWCSRRRTIVRAFLSLALLFISVCMYQVYLELYMGICMAYSMAAHEFKFGKDSIKELMTISIFALTAGVLSILIINVVQSVGGVQVARSSASSFQTLHTNLDSILGDFPRMIISLHGLLPPLFYLVLTFLPLTVLTAIAIRRNSGPSLPDVLLFTLILCAMMLLSISPALISTDSNLYPRVIPGIFCLTFACTVASINLATKLDVDARILAASYSVMLLVMSIQLMAIQTDTIRNNDYDLMQLEEFNRCIDRYEELSGMEVTTIKYCWDDNPSTHYPRVDYAVYDTNIRALRVSWFFPWAIKEYAGSDIALEPMTDDERNSIFIERDWGSLDVSEQFHAIDGTAYIILY